MKKSMSMFLYLILSVFVFAEEVKEVFPDALSQTRKEWIESFNNSRDKLGGFYFKGTFLFVAEESNSVLTGPKSIGDYYSSILPNTKINNYEQLYIVKYDVIKYLEIAKLKTETDDYIYQITEWERQKKKWSINFEIVAISLKNIPAVDLLKLKVASENWIKVANSGDIKKLCNELYGDNGYFLDDEINKGSQALYAKFKNSMESSGYFINFKNNSFFPVNDSTGFEIGKYETPLGIGNFIFVWRKDKDGKWYVGLDRG